MIKDLNSIYLKIKSDTCPEMNKLCKSHKFSRDENADTLLHYAVMDGNINVVKRLTRCGSCPFILNNQCMTALSIAACYNNLSILKFLVDKSINDITDYDKSEILANAVVKGNIKIVNYLLKKGFNSNALYRGDPIIYWAIQSAKVEIVKLLYDFGADLNLTNEENMTSLYAAAACDLVDIMQFIIERATIIDKPSNNGNTPFIIACCYGNIKAAQLLIAHGSDIEARNNCGETALLIAIKLKNVEIIKLLLSNNANRNVKDYKNRGVNEYCEHIRNKKTRESISQILLEDF